MLVSIHEIEKCLTPKERSYWWKLNHKLVSTKKSKRKFKRDENGNLASPKCLAFKINDETKKYHNNDFPSMIEFRKLIEKN